MPLSGRSSSGSTTPTTARQRFSPTSAPLPCAAAGSRKTACSTPRTIALSARARALRVRSEERQEPADVQGTGAARRDEAARRARNGRRRRRHAADASSPSSACASGFATRNTARSSPPTTSSSRSTKRRSASSSRSKAAKNDIHRAAAALGKTPADYITASYRALFVAHCKAQGSTPGDMLFE